MSFDFYLGSASPRRKALLEDMGLSFEVHAADVDETRQPDESPEQYVVRVAVDKAKAVQAAIKQSQQPVKPIITADTAVVQQGNVFGKPKSFEDACNMWRSLSGQPHRVLSSVVLLNSGKIDSRLSDTRVEFINLTPEQMAKYWKTGEPLDKAGAYAIQGYASAWVKRISGSYTGVVGMPMLELNELLKTIELDWL
jgi:septum formation protein